MDDQVDNMATKRSYKKQRRQKTRWQDDLDKFKKFWPARVAKAGKGLRPTMDLSRLKERKKKNVPD